MVDLVKRVLDRWVSQQISPVGLAVFRIVYSAVLLGEVLQLFYFRHLVFDPIPYLAPTQNSFTLVLLVWIAVIVCIMFGLATRTACVVNYVLTLLTFSTFTSYEYHVDYTYTGVNLLFLFSPISERLSLDGLRRRLAGGAAPRATISRAYCDVLILLGVGLVYFDSVFWKLGSPMWRSGLGLWLPASLPQNTWISFSWMLDKRWLCIFLGYVTLVYEAAFVFLMWQRFWRLALVAVGLGLHVGIAIVFPIPWFGLAAAAVYVLLVPPEWFDAALAKIQKTSGYALLRSQLQGFARLTLTDSHATEKWAVQIPTRADSSMAPWRDFGLRVVVGLCLVSVALQIAMIQCSPVARRVAGACGLGSMWNKIGAVVRATGKPPKSLLGITQHPVFMDGHFRGYNHSIAVVHVAPDGCETFLPIIRQSGQTSHYISGRNWVKWTWRVCSPNISVAQVETGLRDFTAFWAQQNDIDLNSANFRILVKRYDTPEGWEAGFYDRQLAKPWMDAGTAEWRDKKFSASLSDIEKMDYEIAAAPALELQAVAHTTPAN